MHSIVYLRSLLNGTSISVADCPQNINSEIEPQIIGLTNLGSKARIHSTAIFTLSASHTIGIRHTLFMAHLVEADFQEPE